MKAIRTVQFPWLVVCSLAALLFAGCASPKPSINWNSRVGHYTYQQALMEFGQPDRQTQLVDGKTEYRWFAEPHVPPVNSGMANYGNTGFTANQNTGPDYSRYLQLTFGPNGVLTDWSKNY